MKSIRTRLIASFVGTIAGLFILMSGVSVYYMINAIEFHSAQSIQLLNEQKTSELNTYFSSVERTVGVLEEYLISSVDPEKYRTDDAYRESVFDALKERAESSANIIENAKSVYFRPDPERYGGTAGFFLSETADGVIKTLTPTNILDYDKTDRAHVGWYYEPIMQGGPIWMEPYANENISVYMISYVMPVYVKSEFLGVLGIDIDMTLVHRAIDNLNYESSTASLISIAGNLLYHQDYPNGLLKENFGEDLLAQSKFFTEEYVDTGENYQYIVNNHRYRIMVNQLENGMLLAISTPEAELFQLRRHMMFQLLMIFVVAILIVVIVSVRMTKKIVAPIQELTAISTRIAKGELGQEITYQSKDEIGTLADSIRKISVELKDYIDYIHEQAYLDAMTGVRNKGAYLAEEARLERLINEKMASFSIYVFDVNGLKRMNDTKGHEYGDMMIKDAALNIRTVFGNRVYRIGGDEFMVFGEALSDEEVKRQLARFDEQLRIFNLENTKYEEDLAISRGVAVYDPEIDVDFTAVFNRADENMYQCKAEYYRTHGDRRRD